MQLTNRQRAVLEKLFDVYYHYRRQPIHYTTLAQALGIANSTAYEMLKLLEQKGYVSSEYHLADRHAGPGRSMVLFKPTRKALRTFRHLAGEERDKEWEAMKQKVLSRLATEGLPDDEGLLADLMAAIPEGVDPISYCERVVAASLVFIRSQLLSRVQGLKNFRDILDANAIGADILDLLPGMALGLSYTLRHTPSWLAKLPEYVQRYQSHLRQMDEEARLRLWRFSREVMAALHFPVKTG
ncbi:MAG: helix-turn-helix domain-containing protein [Chloroflexi bacterium]|nr:helix-turn-helix domain-containing protein [Chloroflexota bacterium]